MEIKINHYYRAETDAAVVFNGATGRSEGNASITAMTAQASRGTIPPNLTTEPAVRSR